ncbi:acyl transferase/acyl hydrolase/lysophospholipase, partial [Thelonectria olida]
DGGGVRGLSSLLILENLMHRLSPEKDILPCNVFRLIGGTSTGGIIAIMLGRLGMSVKDCITAYHSLSRDIFDGPWRPKAWQTSKKVLGLTGDAELRSRRLEEAICHIIARYLPAEEKSALFGEEEIDPCKTPICRVFVVATQQSNGRRVILRNYPIPYEASRDMTIVEACLATSAAPFVFAPLTAGPEGCRETYIDGGLGNNNPVAIVLQESRLLWPRQSVKSLVSIGTGARVPTEVKQNLMSLAKKVAEMIVDAANEARDFESNIRLTEPSIHSVYFRLDVAESMARIGLAEWRMLGAIAQRTRSWIFENHDLLNRCVVTLGGILLNCLCITLRYLSKC